jgi:hypothetical protein
LLDALREIPPEERKGVIEISYNDDPFNLAGKLAGKRIDLTPEQREEYNQMWDNVMESLKK